MEPCPPAKKRCSGGGDRVADNGDSVACSPWEEISPEILTLIFVRIPAEDLIRVIQFVCKSWKEVVDAPYCWTQIDIEAWCHRLDNLYCIEKAVIDLVRHSDGTCSSFSGSKLTYVAVSFILQSLKCLKVLKIPMSSVTDNMIIEHVKSLKRLTWLDISSCHRITDKGLEALGTNCTSLVELRRNFPDFILGVSYIG